jgi:hypothetical protein
VKRSLYLLGISLFLCLTSCGKEDPVAPVGGGVTVDVDKSEYNPGETIRMTVTNKTGKSLDLDNCVTLQGFSIAEGWLPFFHCPITNETIVSTIQPGSSVELSYVLDGAQSPGQYRASVVEVGDAESGRLSTTAFFSGPFQVSTNGSGS